MVGGDIGFTFSILYEFTLKLVLHVVNLNGISPEIFG